MCVDFDEHVKGTGQAKQNPLCDYCSCYYSDHRRRCGVSVLRELFELKRQSIANDDECFTRHELN